MTGKELEILTVKLIKNHTRYNITDTTNTPLDIFEGTDAIINTRYKNYHIDITFDFHSKEMCYSTLKIGEIRINDGGADFKIEYGYRTKNDYQEFKHPVLVIGIADNSRDLIKERDWALVIYEKNLPIIIDKGIGYYNSYELCPKIARDALSIGDYPASIQTERMRETAVANVQKNDVIELASYLLNPEERIQRRICELDGLAIEHLEKPSEAVQLIAVNNNPAAYEFLESPSPKATVLACKLGYEKAFDNLDPKWVMDYGKDIDRFLQEQDIKINNKVKDQNFNVNYMKEER